jgi:UDP-N-acetylmuramoyl-tripeptide--D-alanyl-D-alanine ligase
MIKQVLKDVVVAILTWEAKLVLKKYNPRIVAVTGSVGKTSTKDAIFSTLSHFHFTRRSEKSFNSELGVPLTILGCPTGWNNPFAWLKIIIEGLILVLIPNNYPDWLVLEIGADRPYDIKKITEWIKPDVVVITRLSKVPVHVEFFPSPEDVVREKGYLVQALKRDGVLILNSDDEDVRNYATLVSDVKIMYYGMQNSDVLGTEYALYEERDVPRGVTFQVTVEDHTEKVTIEGGLGKQVMYPALAAIAVGVSQGITLKKVADTIRKHEPTPGRMNIIEGLKDTILIDDTYNSSPVALHEALEALKTIRAKGRKIAVLGDMLELGMYSSAEHKKAGEHAAQVVEILITVGIRSRGIAEGALSSGMSEENIFQFDKPREAGKHLQSLLLSGDVVLIKGSQGVRMEKTVEEVMLHPEKKDSLLVRQGSAWQQR